MLATVLFTGIVGATEKAGPSVTLRGKKLLDRHYESSEERSLGSAAARSTQLWTVCWRPSTGRFRRPYNANVGGSTLSANRTYGTGSLGAVPIATLWPSSPATTTSPFRIETCGGHAQGHRLWNLFRDSAPSERRP